LNFTEVAPARFVPVMVTEVPTRPELGRNPETVGAHGTEKSLELVAVPPGVVTLIVPVAAPEGTVARIWVEDSTVKAAFTPLNCTDVAPVKSVPTMVTEVPAPPQVGVNAVMVGAGVGAARVCGMASATNQTVANKMTKLPPSARSDLDPGFSLARCAVIVRGPSCGELRANRQDVDDS
jgi:hypothetical protein